MIKAENITLQFKDKVLYNNLSFHIKAKENVCLQGASGIGKSTLFKVLLGYQPIESGEIWIDGYLLNKENINTIRQKIIWVPQKFNMSIQNGEELVHLLDLRNQLQKIKDFMRQLQLEDQLLYNPFQELSEGEKQRLIMATCLSMDRTILLLDEPTSSLNEDLIQVLIDLINKETDKTILSISHNISWLDNADNVIQLEVKS